MKYEKYFKESKDGICLLTLLCCLVKYGMSALLLIIHFDILLRLRFFCWFMNI